LRNGYDLRSDLRSLRGERAGGHFRPVKQRIKQVFNITRGSAVRLSSPFTEKHFRLGMMFGADDSFRYGDGNRNRTLGMACPRLLENLSAGIKQQQISLFQCLPAETPAGTMPVDRGYRPVSVWSKPGTDQGTICASPVNLASTDVSPPETGFRRARLGLRDIHMPEFAGHLCKLFDRIAAKTLEGIQQGSLPSSKPSDHSET